MMNLSTKKFAQTLLLCSSLAFSVGTVWANNVDEFPQSIYDGGTPYRVKPTSNEEGPAGLYVREQDEYSNAGWKLVIPGQFKPHQYTGPLLAQLPVTRLDKRYESMALIEGRVTLFSVYSRQGVAGSVLRLGEDSFPVIDALTRKRVSVPAIDSANDVSIHTPENALTSHGQPVLVSIRSPNSFGTGMTFAFVLRISRNNQDKAALELAGRAILIDHDFHEADQLPKYLVENLSVQGNHQEANSLVGVYSRSIIENLAIERDHDAPPVKHWRKRILSSFEKLGHGTRGLPALVISGNELFSTGSVVLTERPSERLILGQNYAYQVFDPLTGRHGILPQAVAGTMHSLGVARQYVIAGSLHFDKNGKAQIFRSDSSPIQMAVMENQIVAIADLGAGKFNSFKLLDIDPEEIERISYYAATDPSSNTNKIYLFVSVATKRDIEDAGDDPEAQERAGCVYLFRVDRRDPGEFFRLVGGTGYKILARFYSQHELSYRVAQNNGILTFDTETPSFGDNYNTVRASTKPFIDVDKTAETFAKKSPHLVHTYIKNTKSVNLAPFINYLEFEDGKVKGLYSDLDSGRPRVISYGQLLTPEFLPDHSEVLDTLEVKDEALGEIEYKLVALHANDGDTNKVNFVIIAIYKGKNSVPTTAIIEHHVPWNEFLLAKLIASPAKKARQIGVIFTFKGVEQPVGEGEKTEASKKRVNIGTNAFVFDISTVQDGSAEKNLKIAMSGKGKARFLSDKPLGESEIGERARFDHEGDIYFALNGSWKTTDPNLSIMRLSTGSTFNIATTQIVDGKKRNFLDDALPGFREGGFHSYGKWRLFTTRDEEEFKRHTKKDNSILNSEAFSGLAPMLERMADVSQPAEHVVLLVPLEVRASVEDFIHSTRLASNGRSKKWNTNNPDFAFYNANPKDIENQEDLFENLSGMRAQLRNKIRPFLFGTIANIRAIGRKNPTSDPQKAFYIKVPTTHGYSNQSVEESLHAPHALYLLETEGRRLPLIEFTKDKTSYDTSQLLIGTEEEWRLLLEEAGYEKSFGLDNPERFKVVHVPVPNREARKEMVLKVLRRAAVAGFTYEYDLEKIVDKSTLIGASREILEGKFAEHVVSYAESLARADKKNVTTSFLRYLDTLHVAITTDPSVRKKLLLNKVVLTRLATKTFTVPLQLEALPPEDPLVLMSQTDFPIKVQEAGYPGTLALTSRVADTIVRAQTHRDATKAVPSSFLLVGDSGSGKTQLYMSLAKAAKFRFYERNVYDESANAIIIAANKLVADPKTSNGEIYGVDDAIADVNDLLTRPNGYRAMILIDDIHLAPAPVREKLINFVRGLLRAEGGMYTAVAKRNGSITEVPTRFLTLFVTMNRTSDYALINKFRDDNQPLLFSEICATLSTENLKIDKSLMLTFGEIIRLDQLSEAAKNAGLTGYTSTTASEIMSFSNRYVVVDPAAIKLVTQKFAKEDARTFFSSAGRELVSRANHFDESAAVNIVVPKTKLKVPFPQPTFRPNPGWGGVEEKIPGEGIESFVNENTEAIPVNTTHKGQIKFTEFLVSSFRARLMESFVRSLQNDPRYALGVDAQHNKLAPTLHAIANHLKLHPMLSLKDLPIDPEDFNIIRKNEAKSFEDTLSLMAAESSARRTPFTLDPRINFGGMFEDLWDKARNSYMEYTRHEVMATTSNKLRGIFEDWLERTYQLKSLHSFPQNREWLLSLTEPTADYQSTFADLNKKVREALVEFMPSLYEDNVYESRNSLSYPKLSLYDGTRFFMYMMDRALSQLPWGTLSSFTINSLVSASKDSSLSQLPGVKSFLFEGKISPLIPATLDQTLQIAENAPAYDSWIVDDRSVKAESNFTENCRKMIMERKP